MPRVSGHKGHRFLRVKVLTVYRVLGSLDLLVMLRLGHWFLQGKASGGHWLQVTGPVGHLFQGVIKFITSLGRGISGKDK